MQDERTPSKSDAVEVPPPGAAWPGVVGDIGGTNARFGLVRSAGAAVEAVEILPCDDYPGLEDALAAYLDTLDGPRPEGACLAIAGPVHGDRARFVNRDWDVSKRRVQDRFGFNKTILINDFEALAHSLPDLTAGDVEQLGGGQAQERAVKAVVGPGTGLGVAALAPCGRDWVALPGEGGHADLAATNDLEAELFKVVRSESGRVSAESLLSGPGLPRLYAALCKVRGKAALPLQTAEIPDYALEGAEEDQRRLCREAVEVFVTLFAGFAGNLALTYGARGGLYVGGGVMRKLRGFYDELSFRERFEAKGRMSAFARSIPTFLITAETPALTGAARCLSR